MPGHAPDAGQQAHAGQTGWGGDRVPADSEPVGRSGSRIQASGGGDGGGRNPEPKRIRQRGTLFGLRSGQWVSAEFAAVVLLAAVRGGAVWLLVAVPVALFVMVVAFGRFKGHWAYEWLALGSRYLGRRRSLPGGDPTGLLELLRPAAIMGSVDVDSAAVGVIEDAYGLTAVLELGDPSALLADTAPLAPSPAELLPPASADQPQIRLQLLVAGIPAPTVRGGSGATATSYRQLTDGRVLALQRSFLAIHVRRSGGFGETELRRALSSAVRRARRRLERDELPCRALNADAALRVLGELAHLDGVSGLQEDWSTVGVGALRQVSFRLRRWPDVTGDLGRTLVTRVLTLPGAGTTVSLAAERLDADQVRVELVVRLVSPGPQSQAAALTALQRLLGAAGARAERLDGTQLAGLAATLPLGGAADPGAAGLVDVLDRSAGAALVGDAGMRATTQTLAAMELPTGGAGLMMGVNRHSEPITVRLFRPEPTRVGLFGGVRYAQLVALRALALGAQVIVQTGRPQMWEPFDRGIGGSGNELTIAAPNRPLDLTPPTPLQPQLIIVDVGPVGAMAIPVVESAWRATMVVRDELASHDMDVLARADLVLLSPLSAPEAEIAGYALGLFQLANLPRVRADMVGIVVGRRTLRWTLLSPTPIEQQLIGTITR
ncbi:type VII secretion protein EccE [Planosporangium mesophilum]|uniref:type VII secretion protein EccE n=1 Tax=Planosporangium mesophilum TaxID=689768 RepID=UPI001439A34B|nr:type VII secretion protein EccE [Planosporangium mesophilum]NJC82046.1 type VII secretion protein EccE [Planosporangium mesophilum]